ncbi:MAG: HU family DNA-binding protein [Prevotella sp.]|jgi:DNA-binding protein HU-beta/integration host factor subunit alpha|nr:HU family DNA-binding protein [Prevotella sp.]MBR3079172.1 HU family DNA-binding protein [Prevotella sp.]
MNNKEFIAELAERTGYSLKDTQKLVNNIINAMGDAFQEDNSVQVPNFGTFEAKKKMERIIVNPSSGQRMLVPPKLVLNFKPNQNWKDKLKGGQV